MYTGTSFTGSKTQTSLDEILDENHMYGHGMDDTIEAKINASA